MRERFLRIVKPTAILLAIGFTYILIHRLTGFALFCPIHEFLGIYCPACGVSRMLLHLARFEIAEAFSSNCVLFCLLPVFLFEAVYHGYRYVRYGSGKLNKAENIGVYVIIGVLLVFAVVRTLYPVDILIP